VPRPVGRQPALSQTSRRTRLLGVIVLLGACALFGELGASSPVVYARPVASALGSSPADDDRAALQRSLDLVDQAQRSSGADRAAQITAALAELDAHPDLVAGSWLRDPLAASPPDLTRAQTRLQAALDALDSPPSNAAAADARSRLDEVLADTRFHPRNWLSLLPSFLLPAALLIVTIVELIWSVVRWPFDRLLDLLRIMVDSPYFGPAALVGAVAIAGGLVLLFRRGLGAALVGQSEAAAAKLDLPPTSQDALVAAQQSASEGQYREACHFVFLSTLLWIEEQGIARFDRAATNREHLARLLGETAVPPFGLAGALEPVVARFDRVWYGQPTATDADYQELRALAERLQRVAA
jgi:hypothetical protein